MTLLSRLFQFWKVSQIPIVEPPSNATSSTMQLGNRNYSLHMFLSSIKLKVTVSTVHSAKTGSTGYKEYLHETVNAWMCPQCLDHLSKLS
jgi:hypothetical protein